MSAARSYRGGVGLEEERSRAQLAPTEEQFDIQDRERSSLLQKSSLIQDRERSSLLQKSSWVTMEAVS